MIEKSGEVPDMPSKQHNRTVQSQRPQDNSGYGQRLLETPEGPE